jgi:hypothetical protein
MRARHNRWCESLTNHEYSLGTLHWSCTSATLVRSVTPCCATSGRPRFLTKALRHHGIPETITIDGSEANAAAIRGYNEAHGTAIIIRQVPYLQNVVAQAHRGVKRVTRPMLGFKAFAAAQGTLVGIELRHMLK